MSEQSSTGLAERPEETVGLERIVITPDQATLIKRTIAAGATDEELALFFFDCKRRGVHPLDKLIHFTKRAGKYTPITSIDFLRARAAATMEYAGNDDYIFVGIPTKDDFAATATVYRFIRSERVPFSATARWSEYYPGDGAPGFMWRKMPHTMLGKCAEALALRKAFPQELSGLYAVEEFDQEIDEPPLDQEIDEPPAKPRVEPSTRKSDTPKPAAVNGTVVDGPDVLLSVETIELQDGRKFYKVRFKSGREACTWSETMRDAALANVNKPTLPIIEAATKPGVAPKLVEISPA